MLLTKHIAFQCSDPNAYIIFTSLAKEVMFLVALVSLFVCLSVCLWATLLKKLRTDWDEILWRGPE